ncbi:MAG: DEAD/DEAH box helicase [Anaerolineae bacterium]|jgi:DEAD/DEAH box helicase domain-containing protein
MSLEKLLEQLKSDGQLARRFTHWAHLPPRPPRYAPFPAGLDPRLVEALRRAGIEQPYTHQARAVEAVLAGKNVVVVTPTASGKTLCYNLPVLHRLLADPAARALYLFPTKALAHDQLAELGALQTALGRAGSLQAQAYDGDTPRGARPRIRKTARIVVSNPDMLHAGILPHHTRWSRFFAGLRYIVLDEIHTYRGIFGSHVANVLRRLKRICAFYGAEPGFVCASATIANPLELAERLVEEPFVSVGTKEDGSPQGTKHFIFYNPPLVDRELGIRRSAVTDARLLAERFLAAGVQTILFARARLTTEVLLTYLRDAAGREGLSPEQVQGYRGGYLPTERRHIEGGLRRREVLGVVATNALELGINIGHLDSCIMTGYPGTIASTWQQAGRAGRRAETSAAILVAGASPLDQYIVNHPGYFFGRSPERALLNPDNLVIAVNHLRCAAFELPFEEGETFGRFPHTGEVLAFLEQEGLLRRSAGRWHWTHQTYPAEALSLRTAEIDNFVVTDTSTGEDRTIGLVDRGSAPYTIHEGAIYLHGGESYLVRELDWPARQARVEPAQVDYYTQASTAVDVDVLDTYQEEEGPTTRRAHGLVLVTSRATSFKKVRLYTHEILGWGEIPAGSIPEQEMETTAYWFTIRPATAARLEEEGLLNMGRDDRGPNWEQQRNRARERDNHRCRHCGLPERPQRGHDVHHIQPFRTFGYVRGQNDHYLEANRLENLVTLCRSCHRRVEVDRLMQGTLSGLAHVLRHLAPLYLMSDPRDMGVVSEVKSATSRLPTITIYDNAPGGLGFSEEIYKLHDPLLGAARELVAACRCPRGCPSCVGPVSEVGGDAKANCLRLLDLLLPPQTSR